MRLVRYTIPSLHNFAPAFNGFRRSPWSGLETEIDRLLENTLGDFRGGNLSPHFPVDLYEDKDNAYIRAELPGVNRDDINVELVDGNVTITAARKTPAPTTGALLRQGFGGQAGQATEGGAEESYSFTRSVSIADDVHLDKVSAAYENGILTVTLPKREEAKPKKITVAVK